MRFDDWRHQREVNEHPNSPQLDNAMIYQSIPDPGPSLGDQEFLGRIRAHRDTEAEVRALSRARARRARKAAQWSIWALMCTIGGALTWWALVGAP